MVKRRKGTAQERLDAAEEDEARWVDKMLRAATRVRKLRAEIARLEPLVEKEIEAKHVVLAKKAKEKKADEFVIEVGGIPSAKRRKHADRMRPEHMALPADKEPTTDKCSGCGAKSFLQERAGEILCDSCYCLNEHMEQNPKCPECKTGKCRFQTGDATVEDLNAESKRIAEVILPKLALDMDKGIVNVDKPKRRRSKKEADPDKRPW